ncbi:hypothetical protein M5I08_02675 [Candidatus Mycobacterium methanotrophicum]|uniref:Uncharacterized protein n=1 Tax=Candidatus Mycobacterium methanotrophicum TaxID=2943498 RepID=A0ABY4QKR1_9MYCO|nr:hypothetical protein [Candidatus Mycobacterium methanotrophicum]UQX11444.1 hypothetical protein M5I08_02675 [Candidatus Mycobacterium methanotrophicum]
MRDQFLVEIAAAGAVSSLDELNRLFTAWCHQHYHRVFSAIGRTVPTLYKTACVNSTPWHT